MVTRITPSLFMRPRLVVATLLFSSLLVCQMKHAYAHFEETMQVPSSIRFLNESDPGNGTDPVVPPAPVVYPSMMVVHSFLVGRPLPLGPNDIIGLYRAYCSVLGFEVCTGAKLLQQVQTPMAVEELVQLNLKLAEINTKIQSLTENSSLPSSVSPSLSASTLLSNNQEGSSSIDALYQKANSLREETIKSLERQVREIYMTQPNPHLNGYPEAPHQRMLLDKANTKDTPQPVETRMPEVVMNVDVTNVATHTLPQRTLFESSTFVSSSSSSLHQVKGMELQYIYGAALTVTVGLIIPDGIDPYVIASSITTPVYNSAILHNLAIVMNVRNVTATANPTVGLYPATCKDGGKADNEADVDCGGPSSGCEPCLGGKMCSVDADCMSLGCVNGKCEYSLTSSASFFKLSPWVALVLSCLAIMAGIALV